MFQFVTVKPTYCLTSNVCANSTTKKTFKFHIFLIKLNKKKQFFLNFTRMIDIGHETWQIFFFPHIQTQHIVCVQTTNILWDIHLIFKLIKKNIFAQVNVASCEVYAYDKKMLYSSQNMVLLKKWYNYHRRNIIFEEGVVCYSIHKFFLFSVKCFFHRKMVHGFQCIFQFEQLVMKIFFQISK